MLTRRATAYSSSGCLSKAGPTKPGTSKLSHYTNPNPNYDAILNLIS